MAYTTLITASELNKHLKETNWAVVDCRFTLGEPEHGLRDYLEAHIPGAVYAHMERDLAGRVIQGKTGRHPLPEIGSFAQTLSSWGIDVDTQVVAYDDLEGAMAARLWWMLHWAGHEKQAVLDGGWRSWCELGLPSHAGPEYRRSRLFEAHEIPDACVTAEQVLHCLNDPGYRILDARSAPRFRGEIEPIDPVAGHVPGAVSAPFEENLTPDGKFLPPEILSRNYERITKSIPTGNVICYCGSGITAAHNILAMAYSGMGMAKLYAGSWSDWIADPARPVAVGDRD